VPRAIYANDLNNTAFLNSFIVGYLSERLKRIAALRVSQRRALARDRERKLREYPVTWAGVAAGYNALAVAQELADEAHGETDESWWLRFGWHFRRVATLTPVSLSPIRPAPPHNSTSRASDVLAKTAGR
jgi:hypothetical protein